MFASCTKITGMPVGPLKHVLRVLLGLLTVECYISYSCRESLWIRLGLRPPAPCHYLPHTKGIQQLDAFCTLLGLRPEISSSVT